MSDWPDWAAGWTPPVEVQHAMITPVPVAGLAALLDAEPDVAAIGAPLPLLWHWVALAAWPAMSSVGADGHPATGGFMPPTPYPRRMWLGVDVLVTATPTIGTPVVVERTVTDIVAKSGSSGSFALVTVTTTVKATDGAPLLVETTKFAYRPSTDLTPSTDVVEPAEVATGRWLDQRGDGWSARPNPVVLTRYSALTANGHRIHYDLPYATQVEGYPNLLVHGPLMATIVAEVARRTNPDRALVGVSCRAHRPYFLGSSASITVSETTAGRVDLTLSNDSAAAPNLTATITLR